MKITIKLNKEDLAKNKLRLLIEKHNNEISDYEINGDSGEILINNESDKIQIISKISVL